MTRRKKSESFFLREHWRQVVLGVVTAAVAAALGVIGHGCQNVVDRKIPATPSPGSAAAPPPPSAPATVPLRPPGKPATYISQSIRPPFPITVTVTNSPGTNIIFGASASVAISKSDSPARLTKKRRYNQGTGYLRRHRFRQAKGCFAEVVAAGSDVQGLAEYAKALNNYAITLFQSGEYRKAFDEWRAAVKADPKDRDYQANLDAAARVPVITVSAAATKMNQSMGPFDLLITNVGENPLYDVRFFGYVVSLESSEGKKLLGDTQVSGFLPDRGPTVWFPGSQVPYSIQAAAFAGHAKGFPFTSPSFTVDPGTVADINLTVYLSVEPQGPLLQRTYRLHMKRSPSGDWKDLPADISLTPPGIKSARPPVID